MPPKTKAGAKASPNPATTQASSSPPDTAPQTVNERSLHRYHQTRPLEKRCTEVGFPGLTPAEKKTYAHANLVAPVAEHRVPLSNKAEREFWKHVSKDGLPIRRLSKACYGWGRDRYGRDVGTYKVEEHRARSLKQARLAALDILHRRFLTRREVARKSGAEEDLSDDDIQEEKLRRKDMAALKKELYGEYTGSLAQDPTWDDVIPIPQNEPENALAQIAYPDDYAEAVSYLRAVMAAEECSQRALRLTEHVITMNPAHYTVWLYRFKVLAALDVAVPDEIEWLNDVSLAHLKNYQIWHHRQLLVDHYYPSIASDPDAVKRLARSETAFVGHMLDEDAKNYHVWSYRQYLVQKLGAWTVHELASTQSLIEEDVRNNSAWSHRFFLVFSDPAQSTPGSRPTDADPGVPVAVIDRELAFAREKIQLAPQNQSAWNYLRGVMGKAGRPLAEAEGFAAGFVQGLGEGEDKEAVTSSYALDLLAEAYKEKGDVDRARLCLKRLEEKWDPVRAGYWKYRAAEMDKAVRT